MDAEVVKIILMGGVPVGLAIVGYLVMALKALNAANKTIADSLAGYKLHVAEKYVPRDELATALVVIRAEGKAAEDRLEKRFDKMESWMGRRFDMLLGRITPDE